MERYPAMKLLVTGGAGFIGSAFIRMLLQDENASFSVLNFDKLTYAGNLDNLDPIAGHPGYRFVKADICDSEQVNQAVADYRPDALVHFAAESHVDRSILSPAPVFETNLRGTFTLLEAVRQFKIPRYIHVSTDEVYGSINEPHEADEEHPLKPSSPYSASKAGSDLLALSYFRTFNCPVIVTRASNNYGPYQFPEKLLPLMISNALEDKPLPVYGDGLQVRDWLFVDDHCRAILSVLVNGLDGEIYNIGGSRALRNIEVIQRILEATGKPESLITSVKDRPGHDRRYALTSHKIHAQTGWSPTIAFEHGLATTIEWYTRNQDWITRVKTGEYQEYYAANYTR
jgi:dTDP-glucose 4,6-dehydratase